MLVRAVSLAMVLVAAAFPATMTVANSPADPSAALPVPIAPLDHLQALAMRVHGKAPRIELPTPQEARAAALDRLATLATPARLASTLEALHAGAPVALDDWLALGVVLQHADKREQGTPLGDLAARVAGPAVLQALASGAVQAFPRGPSAAASADPMACALPQGGTPDPLGLASGCIDQATPPPPFSDLALLASVAKVARADTLQIQATDILDLQDVTQSIRTSSWSKQAAAAFLYTYESFWYAYTYYYDYAQTDTADHAALEQTLRSLYAYKSSLDTWTLTQGATTQLLEQRAALPDGSQAHMLYAVVTPFDALDHWWVVLTLEHVYEQIFYSESSDAHSFWTEATSDYERSAAESTSTSDQQLLAFGFTSQDREDGYERLPFPEHVALRSAEITFRLPEDAYTPLARAMPLADFRTALHAEMPHQVAGSAKEAQASRDVATFPDFSEVHTEANDAPLTASALRTTDQVAATTQGGKVTFSPALPAVMGGSRAFLLPVREAAAAPTPEASTESASWLVASYLADHLTTREQGAAGLGFVAPPQAPAGDPRPILVTVEALGLGLPVTFLVDRAGDGLEAIALDPAAPRYDGKSIGAPDAFLAPGAHSEPSGTSLAEMPWELSFPGYLTQRGVLGGDRSLEAAAKESLLQTPPRLFALTLARMAHGTSPAAPLPASDWLRWNALLYLGGPGAAADPAAGAEAQRVLHQAVQLWKSPMTASQDGGNEHAGGLPPGKTGSPPARAAGPDAPQKVGFGAAVVVGSASAVLGHDTIVTSSSLFHERSTRNETTVLTAEEYVDVSQVTHAFETWSQYLASHNNTSSGTYVTQADFERVTNISSRTTQLDTISGLESVLLDARAEDGSSQADVLQTLLLPWRVVQTVWLNILVDTYETEHLAGSTTWNNVYRDGVQDGVTTVFANASATDTHVSDLIYVETRGCTCAGSSVVGLAEAPVTRELRISYEIPLRDYAPLARNGTFEASWVAGELPTQLEPGRNEQEAAARFAIAPVPNEARASMDANPWVDQASQASVDAQPAQDTAVGAAQVAVQDPAAGAAQASASRVPVPGSVPIAPGNPSTYRVGFAALRVTSTVPASVAVGIQARDGPLAAQPGPVRVTVSALAQQGDANLGGADAFAMTFEIHPRDGDAVLPDAQALPEASA